MDNNKLRIGVTREEARNNLRKITPDMSEEDIDTMIDIVEENDEESFNKVYRNYYLKKILFILLGTCALIISLSIAYYFLIFIPQKESRELELSQQKFKYQQQKDASEKEERELREIQNEAKENQKEIQSNWNRARAECIAIADGNLKSFEELVESCQTDLCRDNVLTNKELQYFGEGFVESCTKNKL